MFKDFDIRFTHALLMVIVILLTLNDAREVGEITRVLHGPLLILYCIAWAIFLPRLWAWQERHKV